MAHLYIQESLVTAAVGESIALTGDEARHAAQVSRTQVGDVMRVTNGAGLVVTGTVTSSSPQLIDVQITDVECVEVDDVGWIPRELSDGTAFTSFGTDPALEVLVPTAYAPEPLLLPAFGAAAKALPPNGLACR